MFELDTSNRKQLSKTRGSLYNFSLASIQKSLRKVWLHIYHRHKPTLFSSLTGRMVHFNLTFIHKIDKMLDIKYGVLFTNQKSVCYSFIMATLAAAFRRIKTSFLLPYINHIFRQFTCIPVYLGLNNLFSLIYI